VQAREALADVELGVGRKDVSERQPQSTALLDHCELHRGGAMAEEEGAKPAHQIDITIAVDVEDVGAEPGRVDDRRLIFAALDGSSGAPGRTRRRLDAAQARGDRARTGPGRGHEHLGQQLTSHPGIRR
jgi:hypothetical protein